MFNNGGNSIGASAQQFNGANASAGQGINNALTGNLDFKRNQLMLEKQQKYDFHMSNTAYQRAAEDLKKAGLNPAMLAGSAASASHSGGSGSGATRQNAMGVIGDIVALAASAGGIGLKLGLKKKFGKSDYKVPNPRLSKK